MGAARPLVREVGHADWFHGRDGMGDMNYPAPERQPEAKHAVDAIIDTVKANPGIVMVTLAPLTNVALALSRAPEIAAECQPLHRHGRGGLHRRQRHPGGGV